MLRSLLLPILMCNGFNCDLFFPIMTLTLTVPHCGSYCSPLILLLFLIVALTVSHCYFYCFSLWLLLFPTVTYTVSHCGSYCFPLLLILFLIVALTVSHCYLYCFLLWLLLFPILTLTVCHCSSYFVYIVTLTASRLPLLFSIVTPTASHYNAVFHCNSYCYPL